MNTWLIADTHFGHEREIEFGRPVGFEDQILKNLIEILKKDDLLLHLGDFCIGSDTFWHHKFMQAVVCKKILVAGNHDKKSNNWYLEHGWDFVCRHFADRYFGKSVLFSHEPYPYDVAWYDLNIHGHLHNNRHRGTTEDFIFNGRVYKLVSMEFLNYKPVSLESLLKK